MEFNRAQHENEQDTLKHLITYFAGTVPHLLEVKLHKLIYIAQLYYYSNYGELLTRARFFSLSYGPHAPTIRFAIKEQLENNAIYLKESRTSTDPTYSNVCMIIRSREPKDKKLSTPCLNTVREVVEDWGNKNFEDILDYTTRTIPFLSTTYREHIDLTMIQPLRGLKRALSLPERVQIHKFMEAPEEAVGQDIAYSESCPVSINEVAEIYLALCGDLPEKIPSREHFGFNAQAVLEAFGSVDDRNEDRTEDYPTDIDKAAQLTDSLLDSICFKHYSGRVALKTGMLFLKRSGYSFNGDILEESWPQGNDYKRIRKWFSGVSVKAD
ncbi:MAG: DUF4065 domain-containing protein [Desulfobacterales bacterium]|nr:DUF4065 domain-containing protein [Desulfobacterales bacterium]